MDRNLFIFYALGIFLVFTTFIISYFLCLRWGFRRFRAVLWFFLLSSSYMVFAQVLKYRSLHFYVDFSHWLQLLHTIVATGKPWCFNQELLASYTINYFCVHFVPFIYLFAPFFKLWPFGETIIILNFLLMASSIVPLHKLASVLERDKRFPLFMIVLLLWYPTFQYIVLYEFEILRFSIPIILWMLYFWEKKNVRLYFLFAILAVFVREEVGLTIMMFGLYVLIFEKKRKEGIITCLLGTGAFFTILQMIMPVLRTPSDYKPSISGFVSAFVNSDGKSILYMLTHPGMLFATILQPVKLANIFMLFLPLIFIPLLASAVLIAIVANLGAGLLSKYPTHISYMLFYLSPSVPFIFYAFIKGWPKFLVLLETLSERSRHIVQSADVDRAAMAAVLSGLLVSNVFFGPSPISLQFWFKDLRPAPFRTQDFHYSVYRITDHHRRVEEFCNLIPGSSVISAQHFLFPPLFKKKGTMIFPQLENPDTKIKADYVFFDKTNNDLRRESPVYMTQSDFDLIEKDKKTWELVKSEDGYFLYKRIRE